MEPKDSYQTVQYADLATFNQFLIDHQQAVYGVCLRVIHDWQAAEDATQETFMAAWRARIALNGSGFAWLLRVAINKCNDELRRRSRRPVGSLDRALDAGLPEPPSPEPDPESAAANSELRSKLELALSCLPGDQRMAVILADCEGLPYKQIAAVTGSALGTVKSRVSRGRRRLRNLLSAVSGEDAVGRSAVAREPASSKRPGSGPALRLESPM